MKLCRFGAVGIEKPGRVGDDGTVYDLSGHISDILPEHLSPEGLKQLNALPLDALPVVENVERFGIPFSGISKYICIGLNYSDHAAESGMAVPEEPIVFMKAISALCGPNDDTLMPRDSTKLDWEVELGIFIGSKAQYVSEDDALSHVAGYCVLNDISDRAFQLQSAQWDKGKGCDTFGPIGPWLVTADEVPDPQNLDLWLEVNGERMQTGNTRTMIFPVQKIVSYLSRYMTLMPGDVIATGTPPGVGMGIKPTPRYLNVGDKVSLGIAGLGQQSQLIVAPHSN